MVATKPNLDEALKCIRCGLCQAVCPVFGAVGSEPSVARGKVQLIRALDEGNLSPSDALKKFVFLCLNCGACTANCPSGVNIGELIVTARAHLMAELGQPYVEKFLLRGLAASAGRLEVGAKGLALYQKTGLRWLARKVGLLDVAPGRLREKDDLLPASSFRTAKATFHRVSGPGDARQMVAYYVGCATNLFDHRVGRAVIDVLTRRECQVIIPGHLECCGMPHRNVGDLETAAVLQRKNVEALNRAEADAIVVDCATCGSTLKGYKGLNAPVYDISEYVVNVLGFGDDARSLSGTVTYHDPCHLVRGQGIGAAPRELLKSIEGLIFREMSEADRCCGGGGSFALTHYDISMRILDRKMGNIAETGAEMVASGCPSCRLQLKQGVLMELRKDSRAVTKRRVVHPVELLAEAR